MDALTGKVLFSHNGMQRRQVASTQKLVTAMVVLDHGSLDRKVVIQPSDTKADPTKLGFRSGEVYSRRELLNALMIRSFNDVALALARDTAGSVPRFAQMMNAKARQMGMYNSRFVNPNGLPADQYSTAIDMARCAYYVYRNPELRNIICKQQYAFTRANGKTLLLRNTNKLLEQHSWVTGMKTGYTNAAGAAWSLPPDSMDATSSWSYSAAIHPAYGRNRKICSNGLWAERPETSPELGFDFPGLTRYQSCLCYRQVL